MVVVDPEELLLKQGIKKLVVGLTALVEGCRACASDGCCSETALPFGIEEQFVYELLG